MAISSAVDRVVGRRPGPDPAVTTGPGADGQPRISVIVPAYREGARIVSSLERLTQALDQSGSSWEVIVVVDGDPTTWAAAQKCRSPQVRVEGYCHNRGKGFALRYGISQARGPLVTFIDSDMEIAPEEIGRMTSLLDLYHADVVVGSKRHPLSEVHYPWTRRAQSLAYQLLVRALFRVRVRDTQTGLKMFRREVADRVVDAALVKRFAFDLELLVLASHFGYRRILECPVKIDYQFESTTNLKAAFAVLWDTAAIYYRLNLLRWYDRSGPQGRSLLMDDLPAPLRAD